MDFEFSPKVQDLQERLLSFMDQYVYPNEILHAQQVSAGDRWEPPAIMDELKSKAKKAGLWNLFLPKTYGEFSPGLTTLEYAPLAEIMGRVLWAPEVFNCSAPDTGNAEVLYRYGSNAQKEQWLTPLLDGVIRSGFAMTEPAVASSDATNMQASAELEGDDVVINGQKWWTSGVGDPRCRFLIFMGVTDPEAERHQRHSMVLVPLDTPGVKILRMVPVFGHLDEPHGHGEVLFDNVRLPKESIIAGPGRGFEIAQGRLGPGRIHHCMRAIGAAERALQRMCERSLGRIAFGKPLANLGGNRDIIANCRMAIDQARLLTLKAAWTLDTHGTLAALTEISAIKVIAPNVLQMVVDAAIQIHGGEGMADPELNWMMGMARALRIADGPDEVHRAMVARLELGKYK